VCRVLLAWRCGPLRPHRHLRARAL